MTTRPTPTTTRPTATPTAPTPTRTAPTPPEPGPSDAQALARCVGDVEEFLTERFTRAPQVWSGGSFDDLLSLADVDAQLSGAGLRRPAVRVVRDGEIIDPAQWTRRARTGAVHVDDLVHPGRVLGLFDDGATIVLQSLQRWWLPVIRFCRAIEGQLGHAVQANAYLTPAAAAGLTPHHDTHDVFVLQVHGTKHWTVREPLVVDPLARHRSDHEQAALQPVLFEAELRPGDCLYLPRGFIHSAETQEGASLHLTVGILATTVHDVLRRLVDRAAEEPTFRRTLVRWQPGPGDDRPGDVDERRELKQVVAELTSWLDALDATTDDVAVEQLMRGSGGRAPLLDGHLLDLVQVASLDDDSVLVRRSGAARDIALVGDRVELDLGDRRVDLPGALHEALQLVLDGEPHPVRELDRWLDAASRVVLARRLVREGVLRSPDGA